MTGSSWTIAEVVVRPVASDLDAALDSVRGALVDYRVAGATVEGARQGHPQTVVARVLIDDQLRLATLEDGTLVPGAEWFQVGQHLALRLPATVTFDGQVVVHPDGRIDLEPTEQDLAVLFGEVTDRTIVACRAIDEVDDAELASSIGASRSLVLNGWLIAEVSGRRSSAFSTVDLAPQRRPMFVMHAAGDHREVAVTRSALNRVESWRVICPVPAEPVSTANDVSVLSPPVLIDQETADSGPDELTAAAFEYAVQTPATLLAFAAGQLQCPDLVARWAVDPDADAGAARPVRRPDRQEIVESASLREIPGKGPWARYRRLLRRHPRWWLALGVAQLVVAMLMLFPSVTDVLTVRLSLFSFWAMIGALNLWESTTILRTETRFLDQRDLRA